MHGFFVCLLPQTVVVLLENVGSFQVLQRLVQWYGFTIDGGWYDCGSHFGKQYVGSVLGCRGPRGERMERFKKYSSIVDICRFAFTTYAKPVQKNVLLGPTQAGLGQPRPENWPGPAWPWPARAG